MKILERYNLPDEIYQIKKRLLWHQLRGRWTVWGVLLGWLLILLLNGRLPLATTLSTPMQFPDITQHRLNTVLPPPTTTLSLEQSFVPHHNGLSQIDLVLVRHNRETSPDDRFTVQLLDARGRLVSEAEWQSETLAHNQTVSLRFDPVFRSKGKLFTLRFLGSAGNVMAPWGYDLDVLDGGALRLVGGDGQTAVQDIRLTTYYQLTRWHAVGWLGTLLGQYGLILLLTLLVLPVPGAVLLSLMRWTRHWDGWAWWGTAVALGAAMWPLIWLGSTYVGWRWEARPLWLLTGGLWLLVLGGRGWRGFGLLRNGRLTHHVQMGALLLGGLAVRLLAIRELAFPAWVDGSRHGLITAVMMANGQMMSQYTPFLPVAQFPYHDGFHAIAATVGLMSGAAIPTLLLGMGQLIGALIPLSLYAASWLVTRRRETAVWAAFLVSFPTFFPAYYASWGRLTQLTGLLVLPLLLALGWNLLRGGKVWRRGWWLIALLAAGLFLLHFRVFLMFLPFALLIYLPRRGQLAGYLFLLAGLLTGLLVGERAWRLYTQTVAWRSVGQSSIPDVNTFPVEYLQIGWERPLLWGVGGLLLLAPLGLRGRRRWGAWPLGLGAWTAVLLLLVWLPTPISRLGIITLNSVAISLFVPLALVGGVMLDRLLNSAQRLPSWLYRPVWLLSGVGIGLLLLFGGRQQVSILNQQTVLAEPADRMALTWLDQNLPADAVVGVGAWRWLGDVWAAQDGGAWIVPLTGRMTSTPPADYSYDPVLRARVGAFNETAVAIEPEAWAAVETAVWLREQEITHLYVGAGGSFLDPALLAQNPRLRLLYQQDGVFIFAVE